MPTFMTNRTFIRLWLRDKRPAVVFIRCFILKSFKFRVEFHQAVFYPLLYPQIVKIPDWMPRDT